VIWQGDRFVAAEGAIELCANGETRTFAPPSTTKPAADSSLPGSPHAPITANERPETTSTTRKRKASEPKGEGKNR
jgi:hypothetical protein